MEFFTSSENLEKLIQTSIQYPSITYHAVNVQGQSISNHTSSMTSVNAVTWGVFPGCEIKQPTVVCSYSFEIWKDEAFALWKSQWADAYDKASDSYALLEGIRSSWWLVNVVDNDFVHGDIYSFMEQVVACNSVDIFETSRIAAQIQKETYKSCESVAVVDFYDE